MRVLCKINFTHRCACTDERNERIPEKRTFVQGTSHRGIGHGQDIDYQTLRPPVLLTTLPRHYWCRFCIESRTLGSEHCYTPSVMGYCRYEKLCKLAAQLELPNYRLLFVYVC